MAGRGHRGPEPLTAQRALTGAEQAHPDPVRLPGLPGQRPS